MLRSSAPVGFPKPPNRVGRDTPFCCLRGCAEALPPAHNGQVVALAFETVFQELGLPMPDQWENGRRRALWRWLVQCLTDAGATGLVFDRSPSSGVWTISPNFGRPCVPFENLDIDGVLKAVGQIVASLNAEARQRKATHPPAC